MTLQVLPPLFVHPCVLTKVEKQVRKKILNFNFFFSLEEIYRRREQQQSKAQNESTQERMFFASSSVTRWLYFFLNIWPIFK